MTRQDNAGVEGHDYPENSACHHLFYPKMVPVTIYFEDVARIADVTGFGSRNIRKVKDHVFFNEHILDRYVDLGIPAEVRRFDSSLDQANAWRRLESGAHTAEDIEWLKHEVAESWYERRHNSGYSEAHNAAERRYRGSPWGR